MYMFVAIAGLVALIIGLVVLYFCFNIIKSIIIFCFQFCAAALHFCFNIIASMFQFIILAISRHIVLTVLAALAAYGIIYFDMSPAFIVGVFICYAIAVVIGDSDKCEECGEYSRNIKQYGPKKYCADCLAKIHAQEKADEDAGKTVKRYVDAPPPEIIK